MAKILCVLYPDPVDGYPTTYARDELPQLDRYPDGQTLPSPRAIDFTPGALLGSTSGGLGLRKFLEAGGHEFVVTADKDAPGCVFERELPTAEVVISQPFWPAYLTAERIAKAPKLKLAVTAGIGSDHVDLEAASQRDITVAEVTYCNSISVAEHAVMQILALVRNYLPSYQWVVRGGWNIADCVERAYDLEGMSVGVVAAGRIGLAVLRRLAPFGVKLHYTQRHRLPAAVEQELGLTFHADAASLASVCDVVSLHCPLHPGSRHMINEAVLKGMKRGSYVVNTARAELCDRDAIVRALQSGRLAEVEQLGQALGVVAVVLVLGSEDQAQLAGVGHQDPDGQRFEQVVVVAVAAAGLVAHLEAVGQAPEEAPRPATTRRSQNWPRPSPTRGRRRRSSATS